MMKTCGREGFIGEKGYNLFIAEVVGEQWPLSSESAQRFCS
jgi:hypothetical protein